MLVEGAPYPMERGLLEEGSGLELLPVESRIIIRVEIGERLVDIPEWLKRGFILPPQPFQIALIQDPGCVFIVTPLVSSHPTISPFLIGWKPTGSSMALRPVSVAPRWLVIPIYVSKCCAIIAPLLACGCTLGRGDYALFMSLFVP